MLKEILFFFFFSCAYLLIINFIFSLPSFQLQTQIQENPNIGKVSVGNLVSVRAEKNRIYGKIIEEGGASKLYLFYFIPLPLKSNNFRFFWAHTLFSIFMISIMVYLHTRGEDDF